jgi:hypothetical protein
LPTTVAPAGTSRVTTLPAPMIARSPVVTPPEDGGAGADALRPASPRWFRAAIVGGLQAAVDRGAGEAVVDERDVCARRKTSSSMVTPSQIKVWLETLQFLPHLCPALISTKGQPYYYRQSHNHTG